MAHPQAIEVLVRRVAREVRVRRAEHWSLRGGFWGGLAAVVVLSFKAGLGTTALVVAPALVALGVVAGATYGLTKRVDPHDIARLADRAFDLADRVATALEWADHPDRTPLVDALVADTVERVSALESRQIVRRAIPLERALARGAAARGVGPGARAGDPLADGGPRGLHALHRDGAARGADHHRPDGGAVTAAVGDPAQTPVVRGARLRPAQWHG